MLFELSDACLLCWSEPNFFHDFDFFKHDSFSVFINNPAPFLSGHLRQRENSEPPPVLTNTEQQIRLWTETRTGFGPDQMQARSKQLVRTGCCSKRENKEKRIEEKIAHTHKQRARQRGHNHRE